jgi:phage shock protein A
MSVWRKLVNIAKSSMGILDKKLSDPLRDMDIAIKDSYKEIDQFSEKIASMMADHKMTEGKFAASERDVQKFKQIAENARDTYSQTDDSEVEKKDRAKKATEKAFEKMKLATTEATTYQAELDKTGTLINDLKNLLSTQKKKVKKAESDKKSLEGRQQGAEMRKKMADTGNGFGQGKGLQALDELQSAVLQTEAEAEAREALSTENYTDDSLLQEFTNESKDNDSAFASFLDGAKPKVKAKAKPASASK